MITWFNEKKKIFKLKWNKSSVVINLYCNVFKLDDTNNGKYKVADNRDGEGGASLPSCW